MLPFLCLFETVSFTGDAALTVVVAAPPSPVALMSSHAAKVRDPTHQMVDPQLGSAL